jgi:D-xylose transport system substrate-binding protein
MGRDMPHGLRSLVRDLEAGRINRRTFLRKGLALGASLPTLGALLAAAETGTSPAVAAPLAQNAKPLIGFLLRDKSQPRWTYDEHGFADEAKKLGVPYISQFITTASAEEQQKAAENMLAQGIKALVMVPFDPAAAVAIVDAAHNSGAAFVGYDETIPKAKYEFQIERDNKGVGTQMAKAAMAFAPKGKYAIVKGDQGTPVALVKESGIKEVLQPLIDKGDIQVVSDNFNAHWDSSSAQTQVEQAITKAGGELAAVVVENDGMAIGAYSALQAAGIAKTVFVTGEDADLARTQLIAEGYPGTTIWTPIIDMGRLAAQVATQLAKGEKPPSDLVRDGIPVKQIQTVPVTKDNIYSTLIAIGFYKCADVYKNVAKSQWPAQCMAGGGASPTGA